MHTHFPFQQSPFVPAQMITLRLLFFFVCFLFEKIFLLEKLLEKSCTLQEGNQTLPAWEQLQPLVIQWMSQIATRGQQTACLRVVTALAQSTSQGIIKVEKEKMCGTDISASSFASFDGEICGFLVITTLLKTNQEGFKLFKEWLIAERMAGPLQTS